MSNLVSLGIVLLSAFAYASLQVNLGCFLLLYHSSVGKHIRAKTRTLATSYLAGVSIFIVLCLAAAGFVLLEFFNSALSLWQISALAGGLVAASLLIWLVYYRFGGATELWLPESVKKFLYSRAKSTNNPVESFSLGLVSCFAELPFSIILFCISANSLLSLPSQYQFAGICFFAFISILPLLILRLCLRKGSSIVSIQRWRTKNKLFLRILSGTLFLCLGIFIFVFEVMGKI